MSLVNSSRGLAGLVSKIQSLKQARPTTDQPQKLTDRAKAAAGHAADLAKAKAAEMEANGALRELGKRAYGKHGSQAGSAQVTQPIAQALARLETLYLEIKALSEVHAGGFPDSHGRLLVGAGAVLVLLLLFIVGRPFTRRVARVSRQAAEVSKKDRVRGTSKQPSNTSSCVVTIAHFPFFPAISFLQYIHLMKVQRTYPWLQFTTWRNKNRRTHSRLHNPMARQHSPMMDRV